MFSEQLKKLRQENKISQKTLAEALYISQQAIAKWENDKASPNPEMIKRIAEYFNVSADYLIGDGKNPDEIKNPPQSDGNYTPAITQRDELDISKRLNAVLDDLGSTGDALMFDGEPLELDDDTRDALIKSIENSLRMGKLIAKQKYTPKKYRKDSNNES